MSLMEKLFGKQVLGDVSYAEIYSNAAANQAANITDRHAMQNMMNQPGQWFTATTTSSMSSWQPDPPLPPMNDNMLTHEAGKASLEELADIWIARWQHNWVKRSEIEGDFFTIAATRLLSRGYLEAHELASGTRVYRMTEEK